MQPYAMRDYRTAGLVNRNLRLKETDVLQVRAQRGRLSRFCDPAASWCGCAASRRLGGALRKGDGGLRGEERRASAATCGAQAKVRWRDKDKYQFKVVLVVLAFRLRVAVTSGPLMLVSRTIREC